MTTSATKRRLIPTDAQKEGMREAAAAWGRSMLYMSRFRDRKLSPHTIEALIAHGIDAPERLLFMTKADLKAIPGIGKSSMAEIAAYRAIFIQPTT
jgi:hypothetical protein